MLSNKTKSVRNIAAAFLNQFITLALGIIIPRLVLVNLGSEANGFLNTVNNILAYVALLEAGVGGATLQALYRPVALEDHDKINGILAATDRFYKKTGKFYFLAVLSLSIVFPFTAQSNISKLQMMAVIFLSGMPGAIKYYFQGKFTILLSAEGKGYIYTTLSSIAHIVTSVAKIVLLICGCGLVELQIMYFSVNLIQVIFIMAYVKHNYGWINLKVPPMFKAISQSKNAFMHQISTLVFKNTDTLIITYFCGFKYVSIYAMYAMLFGFIDNLIRNFSGVEFHLGQKFQSDRKDYLRLHDIYEAFYILVTFLLYCIATIFIIPFLKLYTAGINDISYIDPILPFLFVSISLLSNARTVSAIAINFAGHFKQTQYRSIFETAINLVVSIVLVNFVGIYGVLIGTIIALLYRTNDMILYANKKVLFRSPWKTYRRWLINIVLFIASILISSIIPMNANNYFSLIGLAIIYTIVLSAVFIIANALIDIKVWKDALAIIKVFLNRNSK